MSWQIGVTVAVIALSVVAMARNIAGPDLVLLAALTVLLALGILEPQEALAGFANEGMLTIAVLFVVAAGVRETGALDFVVRRILGRPGSLPAAQARMIVPVALMSAFLNNTPVVAMMIPIVNDWARRIGISPSKLLLPLSYATILGGTVTIIGTSTNLVVNGMAAAHDPGLRFGIFDITPIGLCVLVTGILYILATSRWLVPDRGGHVPSLENAREYTVAMRVEPDSPIVGESIEAAGLRHLPGLFLVEIEREGEPMPAVGPDVKLSAGDQLLFAGVVESVVDLRRIRGLVPATDQVGKLAASRPARCLVEAVVAFGSPLAGQSVRESRFRTRYDAAIIAVHRNGERIRAKIGDIVLAPGDVLLIETQPSFLERRRNDRGFALVSEVQGSAPVRHERSWVAVALLAAMIAAGATGWLPLVVAGLLAAGAMIATRCITGTEARRSLELNVLIAIAAALGLGQALETTGAAAAMGDHLVASTSRWGPLGLLAGIYLATAILTELVTNNAAAALVFPIAVAAAESAGVDARAACVVVMFAASASFMTPIGYQTNLMVYGPGGYRFTDFTRAGFPLQILLAGVTLSLVRALYL